MFGYWWSGCVSSQFDYSGDFSDDRRVELYEFVRRAERRGRLDKDDGVRDMRHLIDGLPRLLFRLLSDKKVT